MKIDLERELRWQMVFAMLSIKYRNSPIQFVVNKTNEIVDNK